MTLEADEDTVNIQTLRRNGHNSLWFGLVWIFAIFSLVQGASYVYSPLAKTYSPSFYVIRHLFNDRGITVFGVLMLAMSAVFLLALGSDHNLHLNRSKIALRVFCMVCAAVVVTILASWWVCGQPASPGPLSIWLALGAISGLAILFPPPPRNLNELS